MTPVQELRAIANERMPERLELQKDCEIIVNFTYVDDTRRLRDAKYEQGTIRTILESEKSIQAKLTKQGLIKEKEDIEVFVNGSTDLEDVGRYDLIKVLGKPVTLQEVLLMLQQRCYEDAHIVLDVDDDEIREESLLANDPNPIHWQIHYDLTKELEQQKPEVIKAIIKLVK